MNQSLDVFLGSNPDDVIRMVNAEPFRFDKQPVESHNLDSTFLSRTADGLPFFHGDLCDRVGQRVWRNLRRRHIPLALRIRTPFRWAILQITRYR